MSGQSAAGRVLIVDDNLGLAENIAEFLEGQGYETQVAGSAEEALALASMIAVEIVITDFRLPGMSGTELLLRLRGVRPPFRALVISAYNDSRTIDAARAAGAEFLAKPLDLAVIGRFVHGRAEAV